MPKLIIFTHFRERHRDVVWQLRVWGEAAGATVFKADAANFCAVFALVKDELVKARLHVVHLKRVVTVRGQSGAVGANEWHVPFPRFRHEARWQSGGGAAARR